MHARQKRPELMLELGPLGSVNPFHLKLLEDPTGSREYYVEAAGPPPRRFPAELAGMNLVGAAQSLLALSVSWIASTPYALPTDEEISLGEVRLRLRRREARLLATLLRRHLARLTEAPDWMGDLRRALLEIDEFLRWEVP